MTNNILPGMPDYSAEALARLDAVTGQLTNSLSAAGFATIDVPIIEPAATFLNRSGEDLRNRIYVFTDPAGQEVCLRPDLTIPCARAFIRKTGADEIKEGEARFGYAGPAFRFPRTAGASGQFRQVGAELYGADSGPAADVEILTLALGALTASGISAPQIIMGDIGLITAVIDALPLAAPLKEKLVRDYCRPTRFNRLLNRLIDPEQKGEDQNQLIDLLTGLDQDAAAQVISDVLGLAGAQEAGGRSAADIATRLIDRAAEKAAGEDGAASAKLLRDVMAWEGPANGAINSLKAMLTAAGVSADQAFDQIAARFDAMEQAGISLADVTFDTTFGQRMDYYTGMVFELRTASLGPDRPLAVGGRYDNLIKELGAAKDTSAVGLMIRPERVVAAMNGGDQ